MAARLDTYFRAFTTDAHGQIQVTGTVDIKDYQLAHLEIIQHPGTVPNLTVEIYMGKISGTTLSQVVGSFPLGAATIHTFNVIGPEMSVWVRGGLPNTAVQLQAWLFLH